MSDTEEMRDAMGRSGGAEEPLPELPQLWELDAQLRAAQADEIAERVDTAIAVEQAAVPLVDRLRGCGRRGVLLQVCDGTALPGTVEIVTSDCVILRSEQSFWLVPIAVVAAVTTTSVPSALPARGIERGSARTLLRERVGRTVEIWFLESRSYGPPVGQRMPHLAGVLEEIGADHVIMRRDHTVTMVHMSGVARIGWRE